MPFTSFVRAFREEGAAVFPGPSPGSILLKFDDSVVSIPRDRRLRKVYLETSSRCNLDCPMCFLKGSAEPRGDMDPALLEGLPAQWVAFRDLEWVHFAGIGEPLVHPGVFEAMERAAGMGLKVRLTTNGTLVDAAAARLLVKAPVRIVDFSLEADVEDLPGRGTRAGTVLQAMRTLKAVRAAEGGAWPEIRAAIVLTSSNLEGVTTLPRVLAEAGARGISLSNILPASREMTASALYPVSLEEEAALQAKLFLAFQREGLNVSLPRFALSSERHCAFSRSDAAVIRWDGHVSPCYRLAHGYEEWVLGRKKRVCAHSFGSLAGEPLERIWDSPAYASFRWRLRRALYASCLDCNLLPVCEYPKTTESDCWGDSPACSDCLWDRNLVRCP